MTSELIGRVATAICRQPGSLCAGQCHQKICRDAIKIHEADAIAAINAWLDGWARHIGDCPGIDDCTCGLTRVRYEAITALAGDSLHNSKGEEYND